jgi:hypothetical protein
LYCIPVVLQAAQPSLILSLRLLMLLPLVVWLLQMALLLMGLLHLVGLLQLALLLMGLSMLLLLGQPLL